MAQNLYKLDNMERKLRGEVMMQTISTEIALSLPNSLKITGTNDIIYPFGNLTTGHYLVSFKWYVVASGNGAYFNMLHTLAGTSSEWAFECYMDAAEMEFFICKKFRILYVYP